MADKGRRAAERRREREGDSVLADPDGEFTDLHAVEGEWVGDESGLQGDLNELLGDLDPDRAEAVSRLITDEHSIAAESERASQPVEATVVASQAAARHGEGGRLAVLRGPDRGLGQDLVFTETVVGRSSKADIILRDESISREHFVIRRSERGFELVDLGSESGTLVNGKSCSKAIIRQGDEIEIGETTLRFFATDGPAPRPRDQEGTQVTRFTTLDQAPSAVIQRPSGRRQALRYVLIAMVVFMVGALLATAAALYYFDRIGTYRLRLDPALAGLLTEARAKIDTGENQAALQAVEAFLLERPHDLEARELSLLIKRELVLQEKLARIAQALRIGKLDKAVELADSLPLDSGIRRQAQELIFDARAQLHATRKQAIASLLQEGSFEAASNLLERYATANPGDPDIAGLRARIALANQALEGVDTREKQLRSQAAMQPAIESFRKGEVDRARRQLRTVSDPELQAEATRLAEKIAAFEAALQAGRASHRAKRSSGLKELERAAALEKQIAGGTTVFSPTLARLRSDLLYLLGIEQLSKEQHCAAKSSFQAARKLNPGDMKSSEQLTGLQRRAEAELVRAQSIARGDRQAAREIARRARCLVPDRSKLARGFEQLMKGAN